MKLIGYHLKDFKDFIEVRFVQEGNVVVVKVQRENVLANYFKIYCCKLIVKLNKYLLQIKTQLNIVEIMNFTLNQT